MAGGTLAAAGSQLEDGRGTGGPATAARKTARTEGGTLTLAWAARPSSLDPARATDATSANLVWNLMDPLVELGDNLEPVPNLAKGWETSRDGKSVTFFLRESGRWTNGDPLTARDFEYAWKRLLEPKRRSPYAPRLFGIRGAAAFHSCVGPRCGKLADRVGVKAVGAHELRVTLASRQPWFVASTAHPALLPVHEPTVERLGKGWTRPRNMVTSGPFMLASANADSVTLVRNPDWRNAQAVDLGRVETRVIRDPTARVQAFDAGDVLALDGSGLPAADILALRERAEYEAYPALAGYAYAFNLASITDVHQRRAMALAVDRRALIDNVAQGDQTPATRFTPEAAPEFGARGRESPWLPPGGDTGAAKTELGRADKVKRRITLLHVDAPGNREIAAALQDAWRELGIETAIRERGGEDYLAFRGPLSKKSVDVYQVSSDYEFPDPMSALARWTCDSDANKTNFCNRGFDALIARARREQDAIARDALYARAEDLLIGERGSLPVLPIYWRTYPNLESLTIKDSFRINPLGQIDLSAVEVR